jgi:hypothetical protein
MVFDFIGDVHGYAERLTLLLGRLGYVLRNDTYYHPDGDRRAVFLGDLIDRGPQIRETVLLVRSMAESGDAFVIMGNHEYNAVCFGTPKPTQEHRWMRSRTDKNIHQHLETLYQFRDNRDEWQDHLSWFASLPLWLDLGGVRAVHAAWDDRSMNTIGAYSAQGNLLTPELLQRGTIRGNPEFSALQNVLKGPELPLPEGATFTDKEGNTRHETRIRWWLDARGKTFSELAFGQVGRIDGASPASHLADRFRGYHEPVPVFFGHYWLTGEEPGVLAPRIACLDYSVATDGYLAAYTWEGEKELRNDRFTIA